MILNTGRCLRFSTPPSHLPLPFRTVTRPLITPSAPTRSFISFWDSQKLNDEETKANNPPMPSFHLSVIKDILHIFGNFLRGASFSKILASQDPKQVLKYYHDEHKHYSLDFPSHFEFFESAEKPDPTLPKRTLVEDGISLDQFQIEIKRGSTFEEMFEIFFKDPNMPHTTMAFTRLSHIAEKYSQMCKNEGLRQIFFLNKIEHISRHSAAFVKLFSSMKKKEWSLNSESTLDNINQDFCFCLGSFSHHLFYRLQDSDYKQFFTSPNLLQLLYIAASGFSFSSSIRSLIKKTSDRPDRVHIPISSPGPLNFFSSLAIQQLLFKNPSLIKQYHSTPFDFLFYSKHLSLTNSFNILVRSSAPQFSSAKERALFNVLCAATPLAMEFIDIQRLEGVMFFPQYLEFWSFIQPEILSYLQIFGPALAEDQKQLLKSRLDQKPIDTVESPPLSLLPKKVMVHFLAHNFEGAQELVEEWKTLAGEEYGTSSPLLAPVYCAHGIISLFDSANEQALRMFQTALQLRRDAFTVPTIGDAPILVNLAMAHHRCQNSEESLKLIKEAESLLSDHLSPLCPLLIGIRDVRQLINQSFE